MNILPMEKQALIVNALAEGNSIRAIERITQVHRDTIMRLGIRIGEGCTKLMSDTMVNLPCHKVQVDELWGFIGKKQKNVSPEDFNKNQNLGDVWTYVSIDADTKIVPNFFVGKRSLANTQMFMDDLAGRMKNRIQLTSDSLSAYVSAVESAFGSNVDYGQLVKTYSSIQALPGKYSPPRLTSCKKMALNGSPIVKHISTSYVESQNLTVRMHCRRLTRLTNAFSKKIENFRAAIGLHFGYYNFCLVHNSLRTTPAMAMGITNKVWSVNDLLERIK